MKDEKLNLEEELAVIIRSGKLDILLRKEGYSRHSSVFTNVIKMLNNTACSSLEFTHDTEENVLSINASVIVGDLLKEHSTYVHVDDLNNEEKERESLSKAVNILRSFADTSRKKIIADIQTEISKSGDIDE